MASQSGRADPSLDQVLFEEGYRFDFFQAVRVLERLNPVRHAVGGDAEPSKEVVRFCALLSLAFPPSSIYEINPSDDGSTPAQMIIAFMGLTGPMGVLPRHYTELLLERVRSKDFTLRDFFDLFNHRFVSLFYRAWEKYRLPAAYERARSRPGEGYDPFSNALFHFVGMGTGGLQGRLKTGDEALLYYGGLIAQQPRSASALEAMVGDYFGVPVKVQQFAGGWLSLERANRTSIGLRGSNNLLGNSAILGTKFWDQQAAFTVRIGPLNFHQFHEFLPCDRAFAPLVDLVRFFVGSTLDFDIRLVLKASEVPACELARPGPRSPRLGWSSWLKTHEFTRDTSDARLGRHLTRIKTLSRQNREASS
jgi:type VI secretion system protein ImpH